MSKRFQLNINRRDFINGCALGIAAGATLSPLDILAAKSSSAMEHPDYPPSLTGMRGNHVGSFEVAHSVAWQGKKWDRPKQQTDEAYDMVIVGGGISGLSAAFFYQQHRGKGAKILILDNHDDFGGHAKRNEFDVDGRNVIAYGGSQSIDGPADYSKESKQMLKSIAIDTERFYDYFDDGFYDKWKLGPALYFDSPPFDKRKLVDDPFGGFLAGTDEECENKIRSFPISPAAQESLIDLLSEVKEPLKKLSTHQQKEKLRSLSYVDYLQQYFGLQKEASDILIDRAKGLWGVGWDALSALEAAALAMPGMQPYEEMTKAEYRDEDSEPYIFHFPDGNASVARSLVRQLIPSAVLGKSMEDLVTARVDYSMLDKSLSPVRIRLNSTAVDVRHTADDKMVDVTYVYRGETYRVRGKHVVMACNNDIIPKICPETPKKQSEAIAYATKVPLVYTNIALRNWRAFAELGYRSINIPKSELHHSMSLDFPVSLGQYKFSKNPDEPIIVHATYVPTMPDQGLNAREQHAIGRGLLYQLRFNDFEESLVNQMDGMLQKGGFDVERDIAGITVNRWPHGYAYEYNDYSDPVDWGPENGPHVQGRAQIGRISIANSDSSALAYVNGAIDAAHRAVKEQLTE